MCPKYSKYFTLPILLLAIGAARADHLLETLLAKGKPEVELARINLETSTLEDVIRHYGPPTQEVGAQNNPNWTGYIWELPRAKLEVSVDRDQTGTQIDNIYIAGTIEGKDGLTGRGLKLGDTLTDLKRIYGNVFKLSAPNKNPSHTRDLFTGVQEKNEYQVATIQWQSWDFTLRVGFNAAGTIDAMWLILPECYPGGCD